MMAGQNIYISIPRYTVLLRTGRLGGKSFIIDGPPIVRWAIGMSTEKVLRYFKRQDGCIIAYVWWKS